jgi:hypothetical protein
VVSGGATPAYTALFDIGSDDTIFPASIAALLGSDLTALPTGQARGVSGAITALHYAHVQLRLSDGVEHAVWDAIVGFVPTAMPHALLGRTGFRQFFDVTYRGEARETVLQPNGTFNGRYIRP